MNQSNNTTVLVVGAGLSGLACAYSLAQHNIPVTIMEANDRVAEPWRKRYPALRLNIHRHFVRLPGMRAPQNEGVHLTRDTVVSLLQQYAGQLQVPITFGARVETLRPIDSGWQVDTSAGRFVANHVVIATGRDRIPHIPDWPGMNTFGGELLHAVDLGDVSRFNDKRVLVVGAGNSGTDVLNHLVRHRSRQVLVSVRYGPAIVPNRVLGFTLHRLARLFAALPIPVVDRAFAITERLCFGNLSRYGLSSHPDGGGTRLLRDGVAFAIDDGFVKALKNGKVSIVPAVEKFDQGRVHFVDGSSYAPEVVIAATGYRTGLESLCRNLDVLDAAGQPKYPLGQNDPEHPGLWFTGFKPLFTGYFDAACIAAERIACSIDGLVDKKIGESDEELGGFTKRQQGDGIL